MRPRDPIAGPFPSRPPASGPRLRAMARQVVGARGVVEEDPYLGMRYPVQPMLVGLARRGLGRECYRRFHDMAREWIEE